MQNLVVKKSQIVEAKLTSLTVGQKYKFTEIPNLSQNNLILYGIEAFTVSQLAVSPSNLAVIPAADSVNVLVTLVDINNNEYVYQIPMYTLIRSLNGGFITMLEPRLISLTNSYVQIMAAGSLTINDVVCFNFYYDLIDNISK